ncbi:MAG: hypothetical protein ACLQVN_22090 [Bryobacteraceae bacterium]
MSKSFLISLLAGGLFAVLPGAAQDYRLEPVATAPPDLPAAFSTVISSQGYRLVGPQGTWCEVWFRESIPKGPKSSDSSITLPIAQGTLLGVLQFPGEGSDRRGQSIKAGLYTLRYSDYPSDGSHQGVAPQRDFALLTPMALDKDPAAMPGFDELVKWSTKASGTPHPAILSLEVPVDGTAFPAVTKEGDNPDWVLNVKVGDLPIAIILVGKFNG